MWNPNNEASHAQQVYHQQKEATSHPYPPHWYRYPPGNIDQSEANLIDYSSEMPADMHTHSRDQERPFKSYPRTPVTMPGSFYASQPAFPTMPMSGGGERDYSQVTSTCSSASSVQTVPSMSNLSAPPPLAHARHPLHSNLRSPIETAGRPSPDSQSQSGSSMLEISSSMSLKDSPDNRDCHQGPSPSHPDNSSGSDASPQNSATGSSHDGDSSYDRHEMNGFRVPPKKRPHNMPELPKDETYWEKRKKNNESAKRSREARRMKEEQIAMRVVYLEQENLQLRTELSLLKNEIEKLRHMLYNP